MKLWQRLGLLAAGMVVGTGSLGAQTTLRFKFKEDDKLEYSLEQKMDMSTRVMDKDIKVQIKQSMDMSWQVLNVDKNGAAKIKMTFPHVKMDMEGPMGNVQVDSKNIKERDDPVGRTLNQVAGMLKELEVTFTMEATGEIKDLKMPEKVKTSLKSMPGADAISDLFSDDSLKKMANGGLVLPKDPVAKGGKPWKQTVDMKMPMGKVKGDIQFTYEGPEEKEGRKLEKIGLKPNLKIDASPEAPFQMKFKAQDGKGTVYFDNEAGRINEMRMEQTMEMTVDINNTETPQKIEQTTSMTLKK